jgi:hypothetical protein
VVDVGDLVPESVSRSNENWLVGIKTHWEQNSLIMFPSPKICERIRVRGDG